MTDSPLFGMALIIILGIGAQWLAWMLRLPSILLLLLFGLLAGPVTGLVHPDRLLGDLLFPVVSLSVAVILYEGGLSLKAVELRRSGGVVRNLVTLGAAVTWAVASAAAYWILGLDLGLSVLVGAILMVTGPTVVGPLLRHLRPMGAVGPILKWEGIIIDPIGAAASVLVFEALSSGVFGEMTTIALFGLLKTVLVGGAVGAAGAGLMILMLKRYWIPDFLQNAVSLMLAVASYIVSNALQSESGLLAVTIMGIVLANQTLVSIRHIVEFKENLRVLLISSLFILLAARLQATDLAYVGPAGALFLAVLVLVARPAAVWISSLGSELNWQERVFLSSVAPRGIVAAAISSIFALRLEAKGYPQADALIPLTFMVIMGTVILYGFAAAPIAYRLRVARPKPQGALIIGAHPFARELGKFIMGEGHQVMLVDNNWPYVFQARMAGIPTFYANILSEYAMDQIEMGGIGRLLALTPNDEVNSLAVLHFTHVFGRSEVYQLPAEEEKEDRKEEVSRHLRGRRLFGPEVNLNLISQRLGEGMVIKKTPLTKEFDYASFKSLYGGRAISLFVIQQNGEMAPFTEDRSALPKPGQALVSLVDADEALPARPDASRKPAPA